MIPEIHIGDARQVLATLPDGHCQACITSPPYLGHRKYGDQPGEIGCGTLNTFVQDMVAVFAQVHRVLADTGTLWLNLGDSYSMKGNAKRYGLPARSLCGVPWRVAFALQDWGWILRQCIIWDKPNGLPEPAKDRCVNAHEYLFLFAKQADGYQFDAQAIREDILSDRAPSRKAKKKKPGKYKQGVGGYDGEGTTRLRRSVWTVPVSQCKEEHEAPFPADLIRPCILASSARGQRVLDPFAGTGTTGQVALEYGRQPVLIDLQPKNEAIIRGRVNVTPGLI